MKFDFNLPDFSGINDEPSRNFFEYLNGNLPYEKLTDVERKEADWMLDNENRK